MSDHFGDIYIEDIIQDNTQYNPITIGGYANFTQQDPRHNMKENKEECLFKLDSWADYNNIRLGDSGILFALISKEDIENCNFENAFVDWDSC